MPAESLTAAMPIIRMCRADVMRHATGPRKSVAAWRLSLQFSVSLGIHKIDWLASYHTDNRFHRNRPTNIQTRNIHIDRIHHDRIPLDVGELLPFDSGQVDGN